MVMNDYSRPPLNGSFEDWEAYAERVRQSSGNKK